MNEKLKLIPIHEEDVIEDEMLNFITAGDSSTTNCRVDSCNNNSGKCNGTNECDENSANCSSTNKCKTNTFPEMPEPSEKPTNP